MPQIARFPENLTGREVLALLATCAATRCREDDELFERVRARGELDKPLRTLSGGTRQKLNAAMAFLFRPGVLILDEPTAGLDPVASGVLKDRILRARDEAAHGPDDLARDERARGAGGRRGLPARRPGRVQGSTAAACARRPASPAGAGHRPPDAAEAHDDRRQVLRYELRDLGGAAGSWATRSAAALTERCSAFGGGGPRAVLSLLNVVLGVGPAGEHRLRHACTSTARATSSSCCWRSRWAGASSSRGSTAAWPCRWPRRSCSGSGCPSSGAAGARVAGRPLAMLLGAGVLLTLVFTALAFLVPPVRRPRRGFGAALLVWLAATALYDAVLVLVAVALSVPARAAADRSDPAQPGGPRPGAAAPQLTAPR